MANNKINFSKSSKIFKVIESVDKAADSITLNGGDTEEVKQINRSIRTAKQATRTEAALIRLRILLFKRLCEIRKRQKLLKMRRGHFASTKGKKYLVVKKKYKPIAENKYQSIISKESANSKKEIKLIKNPKTKTKKRTKSDKSKILLATAGKVVSESGTLVSTVIGNPKADKNSTTDTGVESVKQVVGTAKTTVQNAKRTIKTTKNTVKSVKNAPQNIKRTVKNTKRAAQATYRVTRTTVKVAVQVVKVTVKVLTKIAAFLIENPIVLLCIIVIFFIIYFVYAGAAVLSGGASASEAAMEDFKEAAGLEDVPKNLQDALKLLEECKKEKKEEFYKTMIEGLKYSDDNKRESDLLYEVRHSSDPSRQPDKYGRTPDGKETGFLAAPSWKETVRDSLDWSCGIDDVQILAATYVLAEVEANPSELDTYQVKDIKFTKEVINKILNEAVKYEGYYVPKDQPPRKTGCPDGNCVKIHKKNDEYIRLENTLAKLDEAYDFWVNIVSAKLREAEAYAKTLPNGTGADYYLKRDAIRDWYDRFGTTEYWDAVYLNYSWSFNYFLDFHNSWIEEYRNIIRGEKANTAEWIDEERCDNQHNQFSISLDFLSLESVKGNLKFNKTDELWFDYTEDYFREILSSLE